MGWVILFTAVLLLLLLLIPGHQIIRLWPAGIIAMTVLYFIDTTLISLHAFSFTYGSPLLSGLPFFYWISSFPAGILLAYYYPARKKLRLPYVLLAATALLAFEAFMNLAGYFHYLRWSALNSLALNTAGFILVLWLSQWIGSTGRAEVAEY